MKTISKVFFSQDPLGRAWCFLPQNLKRDEEDAVLRSQVQQSRRPVPNTIAQQQALEPQM